MTIWLFKEGAKSEQVLKSMSDLNNNVALIRKRRMDDGPPPRASNEKQRARTRSSLMNPPKSISFAPLYF